MNLTITVEGSDQILSIDLPGEFEVVDFKAYVESETNLKPEEQILLYNGKTLDTTAKTLSEWNLEDDSLLILRKKVSEVRGASTVSNQDISQIPIAESPFVGFQIEQLRQQFLHNSGTQNQLDPRLRDSINDKEEFKSKMIGMMKERQEAETKHKKEIEELYAHPDDPDSQKKILELIHQQAIDDNMRMAMEETPESFTQVHMLYINCEVNGVPVKAFVDTGAQMTIISPELATKCGLDRLIDRRFIGEARGVGSAKIQGRIHTSPLKIEGGYFTCSFTVLASQVQMLLGLDMLRRFRATIDLKENKLILGDVETTFLPEAECPTELMPNSGQRLGTNIFSPESGYDDAQGGIGTTGSSSTVGTGGTAGAPGTFKRPKIRTPKVNADPKKIDQLVAMGFDRRRAEEALVHANNNIELAAGMLFE
ncbi:DEKNAAC100333 [Brettanomyces naardenensis]|uniref:DNA damage-inducible protein 1 n=1 Tax=Brettanomyces naardenensis TaxID=13370 RepID=A0A448YF30_BRENA|nr:DEKNAAC100333 [Brettanomyces naardenensis]